MPYTREELIREYGIKFDKKGRVIAKEIAETRQTYLDKKDLFEGSTKSIRGNMKNVIFPEYFQSVIALCKEPINVLLILSTISLGILYFFNREEKMHLAVVVLSLLIMFFNISLEVYHERNIKKFYLETKKPRLHKIKTVGQFKKKRQLTSRTSFSDYGSQIEKENPNSLQHGFIYVDRLEPGDIIDLRIGDSVSMNSAILKSYSLETDSSSQNDLALPISTKILSGRALALVLDPARHTIKNNQILNANQNLDFNIPEPQRGWDEIHQDLSDFFQLSLVIATLMSFIVFLYFTMILNKYYTWRSGINTILSIVVGIFIGFIPEGIPIAVKSLMFESSYKMYKKGILVKDVEVMTRISQLRLLILHERSVLCDEMTVDSIYDGVEFIDVKLAISDENEDQKSKIKMIAERCSKVTRGSSGKKDVPFRNEGLIIRALRKFVKENLSDKKVGAVESEEAIKKTEKNSVFFISRGIKNCKKKLILKKFVSMDNHEKNKCKKIMHKMENRGEEPVAIFSKSSEQTTLLGIVGIGNSERPCVKTTCDILKSTEIGIGFFTRQNKNLATNLSNGILGFGENSPIIEEMDFNEMPIKDQIDFIRRNEFTICNIDDTKVYASDEAIDCISAANFIHTPADIKNRKAKSTIVISLIGASDAVKDSSDIVLANFRDILYVIEEGRLYFINLKKSIKYILTHITPQVFPVLLHIFLGMPLPISAILLLFLDFFAEILPVTYFSYEDPEINLIDLESLIDFEDQMRIDMTEDGEINRIIGLNNISAQPQNVNAEFQNANQSFVDDIPPRGFRALLRRNLAKYITNIKKFTAPNRLYSQNTLNWSILQAGFITTIGCVIGFYISLHRSGIPFKYFLFANEYFNFHANSIRIENITGLNEVQTTVLNAEEQLHVLYSAQSTYFVGLVICQFCNMLVCRRQYRLFYKRFFKNWHLLLSSTIGIGVTLAIVYTPFFESILVIRRPSLIGLIAPLISGGLILFLDTYKKLTKNIE